MQQQLRQSIRSAKNDTLLTSHVNIEMPMHTPSDFRWNILIYLYTSLSLERGNQNLLHSQTALIGFNLSHICYQSVSQSTNQPTNQPYIP